MEHELDATITVWLISKINSTCFGQTFAHLQERKTEIFTTYGILSCWCGGQGFWALLLGTTCSTWKINLLKKLTSKLLDICTLKYLHWEFNFSHLVKKFVPLSKSEVSLPSMWNYHNAVNSNQCLKCTNFILSLLPFQTLHKRLI
jgi:hypothetical protein